MPRRKGSRTGQVLILPTGSKGRKERKPPATSFPSFRSCWRSPVVPSATAPILKLKTPVGPSQPGSDRRNPNSLPDQRRRLPENVRPARQVRIVLVEHLRSRVPQEGGNGGVWNP